MQVDIVRQVGAVTRGVRSGERDGKPTRTVVAARRYETNIDDLWEALTSAERIPRWFMPVSGELRLGGRYQLHGNAGGTIEQCDPPRRLGVTWEFGGNLSWVIVTLASQGDEATLLELEHIAIVDDQAEQFWDQYGPGAVGVGWDLSILGLALHVETGATMAPESSQAWMASDNGKSYVRASSAAWRDASIAFGADAEAAAGAAGRTTQFYGGGEAQG